MKGSVPAIRIFLLQFVSGYFALEEKINADIRNLAAMHGDTHPVAAEWSDHPCSITNEQHMVLHLRFFFKADLRYS